MTARLLVIVPTRGRPHNISRLWKAWQKTATGCADLLVAVDGDPANLNDYIATGVPRVVYTPWQGMIATLNQWAHENADRYEALAFWGDDHVPRTAGWDRALLHALDDLAPVGFVYGNDLHRGPDLPTAVAMTSTVVQTLGYMAPPDLGHLLCDRWWLTVGRRLGRITYLPDVVIEHMHYAAGKAIKDDGYRTVNSRTQYRQDKEAYRRYVDRGHLRRDVEKLRATVEGRVFDDGTRQWTKELPRLLGERGITVTGVVQVGAHRGEEVETLRRITSGPVVLVEPIPELAAALRAIPDVTVVEAACGVAAGRRLFNITENTKYASLYRPAKKPVVRQVEVRVVRLADVIPPEVNAAVLDVQGAELDVLAGAPLDQLDVIVAETHTKAMYTGAPLHHRVISAMRRRGWQPVEEWWHDRKGKIRDVVFLRAAA